MSKILKVRSVNDYGSYLGCPARHPLVCVIDYAEVSPIRHSLNNYGVYALFLRDDVGVELDYGCGRYDYNKGTLLCVAPGQVGGKEDNGERVSITGWALLFHPDLLRGTPLEKRIRDYSFFDYRVNEALHMSDREHDILVSLMRRMREELDNERDAQQDAILVGYIGLVLNFCQRFYNRQFQSRETENSDILVRFNRLLADYYVRAAAPAEARTAHRAVLRRPALLVAQLLRRRRQENDGRHGQQPHPPVRDSACQERTFGRRERRAGSRPPRVRVSAALQPHVPATGGHYSVGVQPQAAVVASCAGERLSSGSSAAEVRLS